MWRGNITFITLLLENFTVLMRSKSFIRLPMQVFIAKIDFFENNNFSTNLIQKSKVIVFGCSVADFLWEKKYIENPKVKKTMECRIFACSADVVFFFDFFLKISLLNKYFENSKVKKNNGM